MMQRQMLTLTRAISLVHMLLVRHHYQSVTQTTSVEKQARSSQQFVVAVWNREAEA